MFVVEYKVFCNLRLKKPCRFFERCSERLQKGGFLFSFKFPAFERRFKRLSVSINL